MDSVRDVFTIIWPSLCVLLIAFLYYCRNKTSTPPPVKKGHRYLVGVLGHAGHGKDSIGTVLVEEHGFTRDAFAKPLKDVARLLWMFSEEQLYGKLKEVEDERWKMSPRVALQLFGTEVGRELFAKWMPHIGERFWLEHFKIRRSSLVEQRDADIVVCDVRFPNEAELIKELGGVLVKVIRPGHNAFAAAEKKVSEKIVQVSEKILEKEEKEKEILGTHKSETLIDNIIPDIVLVNDGTLKDLRDKIERITSYLQTPPTKKRKRTPKAD